jgi:hypothetical protein
VNERVISAILEYMNDMKEPGPHWPKYWFNLRSYSRWAAMEILEAIMDNPLIPAMETVQEFMTKMTTCACCTEDNDIKSIFYIAYDAGNDILSILLAME